MVSELYDIHDFEIDDEGILFYTGLETYQKFLFVYSTLADYVDKINFIHCQVLCISPQNQLFLTLIKLRRNTSDYELSKFFGISKTNVSNIFWTWINFMAQLWSKIDIWPTRDIVNFYMPQGFKKSFPTTRAIFDSTEIPIVKPSNPIDQQATFSINKNKNTFKLLVSSTPDGLLSYCSEAYGGSISDRQIFERSNIINKCDSQDSIMVDRGFNVQDICAPKDIRVNIPSFLKGKSQLPGLSILQDRKLSSKRAHIETLIGLIKTYKILQAPLNVNYLLIASNIFQVCFMLCNFREGIISENA